MLRGSLSVVKAGDTVDILEHLEHLSRYDHRLRAFHRPLSDGLVTYCQIDFRRTGIRSRVIAFFGIRKEQVSLQV